MNHDPLREHPTQVSQDISGVRSWRGGGSLCFLCIS